MKTNEVNNKEFILIEGAELETIAASLPVRSNVRAGAAPPPCAECCNNHK